MRYLFDTSTIIHELRYPEEVEGLSRYCLKQDTPFCISDRILKELEPGKNVIVNSPEDFGCAQALFVQTNALVDRKNIIVISIARDQRINDKYKSIRRAHYSWMYDISYMKERLGFSDEKIRSKSFMYKDSGECTLIAIALTNPDKYVIVAEDKGEIYKHPLENIFEKYKGKGIRVVKYYESELCHEYNIHKALDKSRLLVLT